MVTNHTTEICHEIAKKPGVGDNSIFSVFSNIWLSVCLKIPSQFPASWQHRLCALYMGDFFLYLYAANKSVLLLYACAHKISLKYLFLEKKIAIEICC